MQPVSSQPESDRVSQKDKRKRPEIALSSAEWRGMVILGAVVFIVAVGLVAYYFVNEHSASIKFFTEALFSFFALIVIVSQAIIYFQQEQIMREQKDLTIIAERAYLGIKDVKIITPIVNETIVVHAKLFNGGKTPAFAIGRKFQVGLVKPGEFKRFDWNADPAIDITGFSLLPAGAECWITFPHIYGVTKERFAEFDAGDRKLHIAGELRFRDYMSNAQIWEFDITCAAEDNGSFKETYQHQRDDLDKYTTRTPTAF